MKTGQLLRLVKKNLARSPRALLGSAFGVALGTGCLVFFLALGGGLGDAAAKLFPAATRQLEVVLPQVELGALLGEARKLDDAALAQLSQLPGVEKTFPKMALRFPGVTRYSGLFFGKELHMAVEVVGVGLPPELVEHTSLPFKDPGPDQTRPIPVVVNSRLLEVYNKVFAPNRGLPRLTASMLSGFTFPIELGRSWVAAKTLPGQYDGSMQLVGFDDQATLAGISVPLETARRLNKHFGQDGDTYSSVLLRARSAQEVPHLAAAVKELGFELDESERSRALQIGAGVRVATLSLALLAFLITLLAVVNIGQAFHAAARERRREVAVLRALGATARDVRALFLAEAAATGLLGGLAGLCAAGAGATLLDRLARTHLPDFPFKPESFFSLAPWMLAVGLAVALGAALLGAWLPARASSKEEPARALGGE